MMIGRYTLTNDNLETRRNNQIKDKTKSATTTYNYNRVAAQGLVNTTSLNVHTVHITQITS